MADLCFDGNSKASPLPNGDCPRGYSLRGTRKAIAGGGLDAANSNAVAAYDARNPVIGKALSNAQLRPQTDTGKVASTIPVKDDFMDVNGDLPDEFRLGGGSTFGRKIDEFLTRRN